MVNFLVIYLRTIICLIFDNYNIFAPHFKPTINHYEKKIIIIFFIVCLHDKYISMSGGNQ